MRCGLLCLIGVGVLSGCSGKPTDTGSTTVVITGPELAHTPPGAVLEGETLEITVTATDDDGLGSVSLYHRTAGNPEWTLLPMTPGEGDEFTATLAEEDVKYPSVEYYFKAVDAGETPATTYLPANNPTSNAYAVAVSVQGAPLPFFEDFESDDGSVVDLASLGWGSASTGFQGYPWQTSGAEAWSGTASAFHPLGYAGVDTSMDWLITPAIDLSGTDTAQVSWRELGNFTDTANHALYISTTSRDPADGGFSLVQTLSAPGEDAWGRSEVVDLSAYVGSTVYLAWYWEGTGADDWYVDDVKVQGLQGDLSETWSTDPGVVHPGESTTLTVSVTNAATVDSDDAQVSLDFPDGGASGDAASVDIGVVPAGATVTATFVVTIDATQADNRYLPMSIGLVAGDTEDQDDTKLLVGYASTATLDWTGTADGWLQIDLGVGDPDSPTWSTTMLANTATAGAVSTSLDITDEGDLLPPAAGDMRWWTRIDSDGGGTVDGFTISYGGQDYDATSLPTVNSGGSSYCWDPEPPGFSVTAYSTPSSLSPGSTGVTTRLFVTDVGAATAGPVTVTLSSTDADVTVTDAGPYDLTTEVMAADETAIFSGFAFDVSAGHVDSTDVELDLTLDDGVESWVVPVAFPVPYPVFTVSSIEIDDGDGNDDGILDPDESATLTITLANTGDASPNGAVTGLLTVAGTSVATADTDPDDQLFGAIPKGSDGDARFDITVTGGATGDALDLDLALADSSTAYASHTQLILGEPPWKTITNDDDPIGDVLDSWDFDVVNGEYRLFGDELQIRLTSATEYDPSTLFVEAWGLSSGADYQYYRIVAQSGIGTLQGYTSSTGLFTDLTPPTVSAPDAYTVEIDFPVADLGLFSDKLDLGFGTGWCGEPEYYCDQFPDNWGYPYDSFDPSGWYTLSW